MSNFFPPDVKVMTKGDALPYVGKARNLLFTALNMQQAGMSTPIQLVQDYGSAVIRVLLAGTLKIIQIEVFQVVVEKVIQPEPIIVVTSPGMLSGWVRDPDILHEELQSWQPTSYCAEANDLEEEWQSSKRLANQKITSSISEHRLVKASQFSGIMKRYVQAVLGMGVIDDDSPEYISGEIPDPTERPITAVQYRYTWLGTHGIIKTGPQNHWLVLIAKNAGILAMPLPILESTRGTQDADIGTQAIVDEFGGLPSGEDFPDDPDKLEGAIKDGKVLRLMDIGGLDDFYVNHQAWAIASGWAFAENSNVVQNTGWAYRDFDTEEFVALGGANIHGHIPYLVSQHWSLALALSPHDTKKLAMVPPQPVGSGTANLVLESQGLVGSQAVVLSSQGGGEPLGPLVNTVYPLAQHHTEAVTFTDEGVAVHSEDPTRGGTWGAAVYVFYDGDRLTRVSWAPSFAYGSTQASYEWGAFADITLSGQVFSPSGFFGDDIELRQLSHGNMQPDTPFLVGNYVGAVGPGIGSPSPAPPDINPELVLNTSLTDPPILVVPFYCREGYVLYAPTHDNHYSDGGVRMQYLWEGYEYLPFPTCVNYPVYHVAGLVTANGHLTSSTRGFFSEVGFLTFDPADVIITESGIDSTSYFVGTGCGTPALNGVLYPYAFDLAGIDLSHFAVVAEVDIPPPKFKLVRTPAGYHMSVPIEATGDGYVYDDRLTAYVGDWADRTITFVDTPVGMDYVPETSHEVIPPDVNWVGAIL